MPPLSPEQKAKVVSQLKEAVRPTFDNTDRFAGSLLLAAAFLPLVALQRESPGDLTFSLAVGLFAFCIYAGRHIWLALRLYRGPDAPSRIRRIVAILGLSGVTSLVPALGLLAGAGAEPWVYLTGFMSGVIQLTAVGATGWMLGYAEDDAPAKDAGRTSDQ